MVTFEEVGEILDEVAERFPKEFFEELNGGICLLRRRKTDPNFPNGRIVVMGEYCHNQMGRYINIYYGSFMRVFGDLTREELTEELYATLSHEFTHHLEGLAGERGLEIKDEENRLAYQARLAEEQEQARDGAGRDADNGDNEEL